MENVSPAVFKLDRFQIPYFSFREPTDNFVNLNVQFNPSGIYNTEVGEYKLTLNFKAIASSEQEKKEYTEVVELNLEAYFAFDDKPKHEEIPAFFYANSLAIVFPFIRSFVSSMTLQAGMKLINLPLLNLSPLTEELKKNTTVLN